MVAPITTRPCRSVSGTVPGAAIRARAVRAWRCPLAGVEDRRGRWRSCRTGRCRWRRSATPTTAPAAPAPRAPPPGPPAQTPVTTRPAATVPGSQVQSCTGASASACQVRACTRPPGQVDRGHRQRPGGGAPQPGRGPAAQPRPGQSHGGDEGDRARRRPGRRQRAAQQQHPAGHAQQPHAGRGSGGTPRDAHSTRSRRQVADRHPGLQRRRQGGGGPVGRRRGRPGRPGRHPVITRPGRGVAPGLVVGACGPAARP